VVAGLTTCTVCAWCGALISDGLLPDGYLSHGICSDCTAKEIATEIELAPRGGARHCLVRLLTPREHRGGREWAPRVFCAARLDLVWSRHSQRPRIASPASAGVALPVRDCPVVRVARG
jgi:hypothetical protein